MSRLGAGAARRKEGVDSVLKAFSDACVICGILSGKRKLMPTGDGKKVCPDCLAQSGVSLADLTRTLVQEAEHLEAEKDKPKPEGYGGWA